MRIKWYPAAPGAEVLPFPSKITSLDWSSWPWLAEGVGEVFTPSRGPTLLGDRPFNGAKPIPYSVGRTPCASAEVFAQGETYDPDAPPQEYDENGFPLCCANHIDAFGAAVVNDASTLTAGGAPPPGDSCVDGGVVELGEWIQADMIYDGVNRQWWKWVGLTPGDDYRIQCEILAITSTFGLVAGAEQGNPCASFSPPISVGVFAPGVAFDETRTLTEAVGAIAIGFQWFVAGATTTARFRLDHVP